MGCIGEFSVPSLSLILFLSVRLETVRRVYIFWDPLSVRFGVPKGRLTVINFIVTGKTWTMNCTYSIVKKVPAFPFKNKVGPKH